MPAPPVPNHSNPALSVWLRDEPCPEVFSTACNFASSSPGAAAAASLLPHPKPAGSAPIPPSSLERQGPLVEEPRASFQSLLFEGNNSTERNISAGRGESSAAPSPQAAATRLPLSLLVSHVDNSKVLSCSHGTFLPALSPALPSSGHLGVPEILLKSWGPELHRWHSPKICSPPSTRDSCV